MKFYLGLIAFFVVLCVGGGPGVSSALASPDADEDGVPDRYDRCPDSPPGVIVDRRGCPADHDADGIPDYRDTCPGTPHGTEVDQVGCVKEPVADSDGDGVDDELDRCPHTPETVPVNRHGCPQDSDRDMVFDFEDQCPGTPAGAPIDPTGCSLTEPLILYVNLDLAISSQASGYPRDEDRQLRLAAEFLRKSPQASVLVEGHTDNAGSAETNMKISQVWAVYIRGHLIEKYGMDPKRITARGYGATRPLTQEALRRGWRSDRRVEISLVQD